MTEVYIRYNPYRLTTAMTINGNPIAEDSTIAQEITGKRLQAWIGALPALLKKERGSREFQITFHGNVLDYDDVKDAFEQARRQGIITDCSLHYEEAAGDDDVYQSILKTYQDLMEDPYFTESLTKADKEGLAAAIQRVQNHIFPIHVIATMSSGKSTLINALLRNKLMPSKNEACTAIITEILDAENKDFEAIVYDSSDNSIKTVAHLTYEIMQELNNNKDVARVAASGDIPFVHAAETRLQLVDTPGPNNAHNIEHREITYRNISSAAENLILYVLNYAQLATDDDAALLQYIAEEIKRGGKETRDRFIFVLNRIDEKKSEDSVPQGIEHARAYLAKQGITDPLIFPCSALAALDIRTLLADIDPYDINAVETLTEETGNEDIAEAAGRIRKINRSEELHLEQYSTLTPSEQEKLRERLMQAKERGDLKTEALIHSGICSVESAIRAYVEKYAKAKKIREFVEPLEAQLRQAENEAQAKLAALSGGAEAAEIRHRSEAIRSSIQKGEEAQKFKAQIEQIDPLPAIKKNTEKLMNSANIQLIKSFRYLGAAIDSKKEALRFVNQFADDAAEILSQLTAKLEIAVEQEIKQTGTKLIHAYQAKLEGFDASVGSGLSFKTSDLIEGVLSRMKANAAQFSPSGAKRGQFETDIDAIHEDKLEEYIVPVKKTRQEEVEVQDGVNQIEVGKERVVVGTHTKKVTKQVPKPRKGLFKKTRDKLFGERYEEVEEVQVIEDVEYRPVYEYVPNIITVIKEIEYIDEETRTRAKYVVQVADLQKKLITPIRQQLDTDIAELMELAKIEIAKLKEQFLHSFDVLDQRISEKYEELASYTQQQDANEQQKQQCEEMLAFIQDNRRELSNALDI